VLDGGPAMLRDVAMATNFGTKIAINWLCVNDSDYRQLVVEGDLTRRPTECTYSRYPTRKGRCHGNHCWLSVDGVHIGAAWRMRLNRRCAARRCGLMSNYFDHLLFSSYHCLLFRQ